MKMRTLLPLGLLLLAVGCRPWTTRGPVVQPAGTEFPGKSALRTGSAEAFGQAISQQILVDAARQIAEGKSGPVTVSMRFRVDINSMPGLDPFPPDPIGFPPAPTKEEVMSWDICWIMCEAKTNQCYADCTNPGFSPIVFRTCDDIWEDYHECTNAYCRTLYMKELLAQGCIAFREVDMRIPVPVD